MVDSGTVITGQGTQTTGVISKSGAPLANLSFTDRGAILKNAMQPPPVDTQAQQNVINFSKFQAGQPEFKPGFTLSTPTPYGVESARAAAAGNLAGPIITNPSIPQDQQSVQNAIEYAKFQAAQVSGLGLSPADYAAARQNAFESGLRGSGYLSSPIGILKAPTELYTKGYLNPEGQVNQSFSYEIPQSTPISTPQPKQYQLNLSESLGVGDSGAKAPPTNPIIGYTSGIDNFGTRFQTPIFATPPPPKADVPNPFSAESTKTLSNIIGGEVPSIKQAPYPTRQAPTISNESPDVTNFLKTPEGKDALLNYAMTNSQNNLINFENKLIDYQNTKNAPLNQIIEQSNINAKVNNAIDRLVNFDIARKNSVIENANSVIKGSNAIDRLANQDITQRNQLISQQNINNAVENAIGKLEIKSFVEKAAQSGVKSFDILGPSAIGGAFGSQGVKIGTTTPEKALSDLASFQEKGIPVSLSYQPVQKPSAGPLDILKSEIKASPIGELARGFFAGVGATNARVEVQTPFTGLSSSVKEGATNLVPNISSFATQTYQPPPKIDSGFFSPRLLGQNPQYITGGLIGAGITGGLQVGAPGAGKALGVVSDLLKSGSTKGLVSDIARAASRGETTIAPQIEKITPDVFHITQGTEGRSFTPTQAFQKVLDIFRLPTSKNVPGFGTVATEEGKVGAREVIQPKITQPIGNKAGEATISDIFVTGGKGGIVTYIPKTISENVKPTSVLIENANPEIVSSLNLKPIEGTSLSFGKLTPETRLVLVQAEEKGFVKKEAQGLSFPATDVSKSPDVYAAVAKNPELLGETGTAATEKIFPDITRPEVTAIYSSPSKGFGSPKGLTYGPGSEGYGSRGLEKYLASLYDVRFAPVVNPITGGYETIRGFGEENIPRPQKKTTAFSLEGIGQPKIGAGSSGKANALINEQKTESIINDFFKGGTTQKEEKIGTYTGFAPQVQKGRTRYTQETEIIAFPPGTKSELIGKQIQGLKLTNDILQQTKEKQSQANRASTLSRLSSELSQRQSETNLLKTLNISGQRGEQNVRQGLRINVGSLLGQRQGQRQIQGNVQGLDVKQSLITNPLQTERTGLQQGQLQGQIPDIIHLTDLIPGIPYIPGQTTKPPKIITGLGGGDFQFPQGGAGGKRKKTGRSRKGFFAYSVNPGIVGSIEQAGLPGLQVSRSSGVYQKVDKQLQKATRLQLKGKTRL